MSVIISGAKYAPNLPINSKSAILAIDENSPFVKTGDLLYFVDSVSTVVSKYTNQYRENIVAIAIQDETSNNGRSVVAASWT